MDRLDSFVRRMEPIARRHAGDEPALMAEGAALLHDLVAVDDWLLPAYSQPNAEHYQQYLLYLDPAERFCVVSFVWGPGQKTPIHDHTVWGLIGMLRGEEHEIPYRAGEGGALVAGVAARLRPGEIGAVSPAIGDVHTVSNAIEDAPSISIHVYGGDIGRVRRSVYDLGGATKPFVSSYAPAAT